MLLVVDNGSVYTKNLIGFLSTKQIEFKTIFHNQLEFSSINKFTSFILSGRRSNDQKMNVLNSKIIHHAIDTKKSLLGICYGAEILALSVGGTIKKSIQIQKGVQKIRIQKKNPLCDGEIHVFQSHQYEISNLGNTLSSIAESENCKHEIVQLEHSNIFGTQFHPEMSNDGKSIIEAFLAI